MRGPFRPISSTRPTRTLRRLAGASVPVAAALTVTLSSAGPALAATTSWTRQFGTPNIDTGADVAADAAGYTVVGTVYERFAGPHIGYSDGYIRRYDHAGNLVWQRQFGTRHQEGIRAVASDPAGFTVLGDTDGYFPGYTGTVVLGEPDFFVRRFDRDGEHLWTRQFGTPEEEEPGGIWADESGVTIVGTTGGNIAGRKGATDGVIRRYDRQGTVKWTRQFGTVEHDSAMSVSGDANGFTVGGDTNGDFAGTNAGPYGDAFLRRFDRNGAVLWTRQFGEHGDDWVAGIATDSTGITIAGPTRANASDSHYFDAYIRRYDFTGRLLWARVFGGSSYADVAYDLAQDAAGLTVVGYTAGALDGKHAGHMDIFVRRYTRSGGLTWRTQFGTPGAELPMGVAASGASFAVVGHTQGSIAATNKGDTDAFLRRYTR